jgi:hypothetical protein
MNLSFAAIFHFLTGYTSENLRMHEMYDFSLPQSIRMHDI